MGIKYKICKGKDVVKRDKVSWPKYAKRKGYELQVWEGKGKGWKCVSRGK